MEIQVPHGQEYRPPDTFTGVKHYWQQYEAYVGGSLERMLPDAKITKDVHVKGLRTGLPDFGTLEPLASAVANMENIHLLTFFCDSVNHAVDVRLVAIEQMPKTFVLRHHRASGRMLFEA
jgi:hypothetical protein